MTALAELKLDYTEVTDKGLAALSAARKLQALSLDSTYVTDKSMPLVRSFQGLTDLNLYHTLVTDKGFAEVHSALPQCRIIWDPESSLPNRRRS